MDNHGSAANNVDPIRMPEDWFGKVMTVQGAVDPECLGVTLPHEHILLYHSEPNVVLSDLDIAVEEVACFEVAGGGTIVEMTNIGLKRDPVGLRRVAEETGVLVVMGCGYYKDAWHPEDMDERSEKGLTAQIVQDLVVGADGTDIRAGVIGEIGISSLTPNEEKVLCAAAGAQRQSGAAVNLHFDIGAAEALRMRALDILEHEGVNLNRVVTSHFRPVAKDNDYHVHMVARGTYVEFDLFGQERLQSSFIPEYRAESEALRELIDRGCLDRILFSSDICYRQTLVRNGGWGYAHLLTNVAPRLMKHGITENEIQQIMVQNPKRLLPFQLE